MFWYLYQKSAPSAWAETSKKSQKRSKQHFSERLPCIKSVLQSTDFLHTGTSTYQLYTWLRVSVHALVLTYMHALVYEWISFTYLDFELPETTKPIQLQNTRMHRRRGIGLIVFRGLKPR